MCDRVCLIQLTNEKKDILLSEGMVMINAPVSLMALISIHYTIALISMIVLSKSSPFQNIMLNNERYSSWSGRVPSFVVDFYYYWHSQLDYQIWVHMSRSWAFEESKWREKRLNNRERPIMPVIITMARWSTLQIANETTSRRRSNSVDNQPALLIHHHHHHHHHHHRYNRSAY